MQKIIPHLWFDREASKAARFYVDIFPNSSILSDSSLGGTPSG
ncbi:MAG: VOC family protein, partial [Spirochaetota bacterium]